jgi:hypothetical protein
MNFLLKELSSRVLGNLFTIKITSKLSLALATTMIFFACSRSVELNEQSNELDSATLTITGGDGQFAPLNSTFTFPIEVTVGGLSDVEGIPIFFEATTGSTPVIVNSAVVNTDASGIAQTTVSTLGSSGTAFITARIVLATETIEVTFNLFINGLANRWRVTPATTTPTAGTPFNIQIEAVIDNAPLGAGPEDTVDTTFNGLKELFFATTAVNSPGGNTPTLPADGFYTFTLGVVTVPVTLVDSSENVGDTYDVTVTGSGLGFGDTGALQILDDVPAEVRIVDTNLCTANEINAYSMTVPTNDVMYSRYYDAYGNCIEAITANSNWAKTIPDGALNFVGLFANVDTITLDPSVVGTGNVSITDTTYAFTDDIGANQLVINDGAPDRFVITGIDFEPNFTVTAGTAYDVYVEMRDIDGNKCTTYDGLHTLTWGSDATATAPPAAIAPVPQNAVLPAGGPYTFVNGVLVPPLPQVTFFNAAETPNLTVNEATLYPGDSGPINVNTTAHTYTLVRDQALGVGGDAATFDATAATRTADDSYTLYCATYDTIGNYLGDDATATWSEVDAPAGVMIFNPGAGFNITPGTGPTSSIVFAPTLVGTGTITCDVGGITDNTGLFTIVPGVPTNWGIDGGTGDGNAFAETAATDWPVTVNLYDSDNNPTTNYTNLAYPVQMSYLGSTALDTTYPADVTPGETSIKINNTNGGFQTFNLSITAGSATVPNNMLLNDTEAGDEPRMVLVDPSFSIASAISGLITVNQGPLAHLSIMDAALNAGNNIDNTTTMDTDTALSMWAAGFDDAGNYLDADQNADWSSTAPVGDCVIADLTPVPGPITSSPQIDFDADTAPGTCTITAEVGAISDSTNVIGITNGVAASFEITESGGLTTLTAGQTYNIRVRALDADGNLVINYPPDTTYSFTHTNGASPEGVGPDAFTLLPADFSGGVATMANFVAYDAVATTPFTIQVDETGAGTVTGTSAAFTLDPADIDHFGTQNSVGPFTADNTTTWNLEVESRDAYGNPTTTGAVPALITLTANQVADEALVDTIGGGPFAFVAPSTTYNTLLYGVSHDITVQADGGGFTTPVAQQEAVSFTNPGAGAGIVRYDIINCPASVTAGAGFTCQVAAKDAAGNQITGIDAYLDTLSFTFGSTANTSPYLNAPTYHSGVVGGAGFSNGLSPALSFNFFTAESVPLLTFTTNDGAGKTGDGISGNIVVDYDVLALYENTTTTLNPDGDGVDTFNATITARDAYGNIRPGDTNIDLGINHITAETPGNLGGSSTNINLGSGTHTINDLTYDVFGTMELTMTAGNSVPLLAARSVDYVFNATIGSLDNYEIAFASPVTAGATLTLTVTARDAANNTLTGLDGALNARTFTITTFGTSQEGDTPTIPTTPTTPFIGGVATFDVTPRLAETIAAGDIDIVDNGGIAGTSTGALVVDPDTADHIVFTGANTATADNTTNYVLQIQSRDQFGNPVATGNAADASLDLEPERLFGAANIGPLTGTGITTIDLQNNSTVTINDIRYQVPHTVRWDFTAGTPPSIAIDDALSVVVAWQMATGSVASYTLTPSATTNLVAGVPRNYTLTPFDGGGNMFVGEDPILSTINYTFTTSADCDAPNATALAAANDPADGTKVYAGGVVSLPWNFYNAETGNCNDVITDLSVTDTTNGLPTVNPTGVFTIIPNNPDHFITTAVGFAANANGVAQPATQVDITLEDQYGNDTTGVGADFSGTLLTINKVSGYGALNGTLEACSPAAGNACGVGRQPISAINVDFTTATGAATQSIYDLSYDVGNVIEIVATDDGGGTVTTATGAGGDSADLTFNTVAATVASYTVEKVAPLTGTAGVRQEWQVQAFDTPGNLMDGAAEDLVLSGISLTMSEVVANTYDAPDGTPMDFPVAGTKTFTAGTATYTAAGDGPISYLDSDITAGTIQITDGSASGTNVNVVVMSAGGGDHVRIVTSGFNGTQVADGTVYGGTDATFTMLDQWDNPTTYAPAVQAAPRYVTNYGALTGTVTGSLTNGGPQFDITLLNLDFSTLTTDQLFDLSYNVGHTIELNVDDGTVTTAAPDSANIVWCSGPGTIDDYTMVPVNGTDAAGAAHNWTLTAIDAAGNIMDGNTCVSAGGTNDAVLSSLTYTFTDLSGGNMDAPDGNVADVFTAPAPGVLPFISNTGSALVSFTMYHATNDVGIGDIQIDDGTITDTNSAGHDIIPAANAEVHYVTQPDDELAGDIIGTADFTVEVTDQYGNREAGSGTPVTVAYQSGGNPAVTFGGNTTRNTVAGLSTFNDVTADLMGNNYVLRASSGALVTEDSNTFDIDHNVRTQLTFTTQPTTNTISTATMAIQVEVQDAFGNLVDDPPNENIQLLIETDDSLLGDLNITGGGSTATVGGVANFAAVNFDKIEQGGGHRITAQEIPDGTLTDENSIFFSIDPGADDHLAFVQQPTAITTDDADFTPQVQVEVQDVNDNRTTTAGTMRIQIGTDDSSGGIQIGGAAFQDQVYAGGLATFSGLDINRISLTTGHTLSVDRTVPSALGAVASNLFTVSPGADDSLNIVSQPTSQDAGANIGPITVEVLDADGNRTTSTRNVTLEFNTDPSGGTARFLPGSTVTVTQAAAAGLATFNPISIDLAYVANYDLIATSLLPGPAMTTDVTGTFVISPDPTVASVNIITEPVDSTSDTNITTFDAEILDAYGNRIYDDNTTTMALSFLANPGTSTLTGTNPQTVASGVATFNDINLDKVGVNYQFRFTASGQIADSALFDITPGTPNKLVWQTEPVANETINKNFGTQPVVEIHDVNDNLVNTVAGSGYTITLANNACAGGTSAGTIASASAVSALGIATFAGVQLDTAETYSFEATNGGLTNVCMTGTDTVYAPLAITAIGGRNVNDNFNITVTGGVPPLNGENFSVDNSGVGAIAGCGVGCYNVTVGNDGGLNDTFEIFDSAAVPNTDTDTFLVTGARLSKTLGDETYPGGPWAIDTSVTFTITNSGNANVTSANVTFTPTGISGPADWDATPSDNCDGFAIASGGGTCTIQVDFIGSTAASGGT